MAGFFGIGALHDLAYNMPNSLPGAMVRFMGCNRLSRFYLEILPSTAELGGTFHLASQVVLSW